MNTKETLEKIKLVHGDKYKISDSWEYENAKKANLNWLAFFVFDDVI